MAVKDETDSEPLVHKAEAATKKATETTKSTLTVLWNDLPKWMQDNHYIYSGYRAPSNSYSTSFASLGYLHNESVNIYTHLIGALLATLAAAFLYMQVRPRFEQATPEDLMVFSCFFIGAVACLGMSATYHTISNHSEAVARFGNRLDYIGIIVLIWGSFVPAIYYGFSAEPGLVRVYWTMVCCSSSSGRSTLLTEGRSRRLALGHSSLCCTRGSGVQRGGLSGPSCSLPWVSALLCRSFMAGRCMGIGSLRTRWVSHGLFSKACFTSQEL